MSFHRPISGHAQAGHRPLSDEELYRLAPSIFAVGKHESRSERYTYIPTSRVLEGLRNEGWLPYFAQQGRSRTPGKADYTKHLIRLRRDQDLVRGADLFNAVLVNSHDGTSGYKIYGGVWRTLCANGLIAAKETIAEVKVPHRGDIVNDVIEGTYTVVNEAEQLMGRVDEMKSIKLKPHEVRALAVGALLTRYDSIEDAGFNPREIVTPRRSADVAPDLWTNFNIAQEAVIRGGQRRVGRVAEDGKRLRDSTAKPIQAIDDNTKVNRALWAVAELLRSELRTVEV
jgi:hypothetical protein